MSSIPNKNIRLPESLDQQLKAFRYNLRRIKISESIGLAITGILTGFLIVFSIERWIEMPSWSRWTAWILAAISIATIPWWLQRWVLRYRTHASLAKLMTHKLPNLGDSLLSAIELASNPQEQQRSPALCRAALEQVASVAAKQNLNQATPTSYYKHWLSLAGVLSLIAIALSLVYPAASANSWARFLSPWRTIERFTFTKLGELPSQWIVPHGESITLAVPLMHTSDWKPNSAQLWLPGVPALQSNLQADSYKFELPPMIRPTEIQLRIGDATPRIKIEPTTRPELLTAQAKIALPDYLQISEPITKDIRSGSISLVEGSRYTVEGEASRELRSVTLDSQPLHVQAQRFDSEQLKDSQSSAHSVRWTDQLGLTSKSPFPLNVTIHPDEEPTIYIEGMPRAKVLLESEQLKFLVHASDDFGVKQVGLDWRTAEGAVGTTKTSGEQILIAGGASSQRVDADAIFQASAMGIAPQPLEVRVFVEDYLPGRKRVYSNPFLLMVLNPSDHALWVLQQFNRWQREALEVRDRELQLLETNKKLRSLSEDQLSDPDVIKQIEQQASAEGANARRLSNLTQRGEDLLRQASRNSEIGVGHLEKWAEMQKILKEISASRMPSVANLLKQAAKNAKQSNPSSQPNEPPKIAGTNRNESTTSPSKQEQEENNKPTQNTPRVVDAESTQQPETNNENNEEPAKKKPSTGSLGLPTTTLAGAKSNQNQEPPPPSPEAVEQAVEQQLALLEEFDKVSEELNKVMANLEGSTLVKRFKAAAREQIAVADSVSSTVPNVFGSRAKKFKSEDREALDQLSARENNALNNVGQIIDDLQAFHERRPMVKFRDVLDDIQKEDPVAGLRKLSSEVLEQQGVAIAEAEFWSDTFDRWAEDLVDPAAKGQCPGGKSKGSLPPSIVLEVMQILEGEMNLRERTRVADQAKPAAPAEQYQKSVDELGKSQYQLRDRIAAVADRIAELPNADEEFGKEIELMQQVELAMNDAANILKRPDTGKAAVAAETEAIELLLSSKRINPKSGGGGGGSNPGGGGSGDTSDAAIAMVGPGVNEKEIREDHPIEQSTGTSSSNLPEEFRFGLDQYFERIERRP